ncbi:MAG: methyltransferase domain-containing protein [Actinomycetia bacterium]|nr:methyltransferase domain-containing protein [Actinomycetes bacterium]
MPDSQQSRPASTNVRTAAVWEAVRDLAAARQRELGRPLVVLDLGGGTGGLAVPLALAGHHVHVLDPSPDALASLRRRASEQGLPTTAPPDQNSPTGDSAAGGTITATQGDAETITDEAAVRDLVGGRPIDLICCHEALEWVDDPASAVRAMARILAPGGALSLVTSGRLAAVLGRVLAGRFAQAQRALTSSDGRWGDADPMPRRFSIESVHDWLTSAGFAVASVAGVRLFADLVPSAYIDTETDRRALLDLEAAIDKHDPLLGGLGAAIHFVAWRRS